MTITLWRSGRHVYLSPPPQLTRSFSSTSSYHSQSPLGSHQHKATLALLQGSSPIFIVGFVDVDLLKPDHDNVLVEREDCILGLSCV
ncbi:hypothetical protein P8452_75467 [Trifolium repens]|nr:hypothetical protein P8452_75467 [Trifolium repens]